MKEKKHGIFDYSHQDNEALTKRMYYKYGIEYEHIQEYATQLHTLGNYKDVKESYGVIKSKLKEDEFKERLYELLKCDCKDVKITNMTIDTSTGYFISKFF